MGAVVVAGVAPLPELEVAERGSSQHVFHCLHSVVGRDLLDPMTGIVPAVADRAGAYADIASLVASTR